MVLNSMLASNSICLETLSYTAFQCFCSLIDGRWSRIRMIDANVISWFVFEKLFPLSFTSYLHHQQTLLIDVLHRRSREVTGRGKKWGSWQQVPNSILLRSRPIKMRAPILYLANSGCLKMLLTPNKFLYTVTIGFCYHPPLEGSRSQKPARPQKQESVLCI